MFILVTGSAGFIGFHLSKRLLESGINVIGIDNINPYYDINLKIKRNKTLLNISKTNNVEYKFYKCNIEDMEFISKIFINLKPKYVINLAAQAGVRYSIENPSAYIYSNLLGFNNIIECSKNNSVKHFIYASSSSVYGGNKKLPFKEKHNVDHPISLYAATKRSNELIAHSYCHLFNLPCTGLRFFTVYGPWGRPDMALFLFTRAIIAGEPINIFNNGEMIRDFTFIDDVIESILILIFKIPKRDIEFDSNLPNPSKSWARYKILNIGNSEPTSVLEYIKEIEKNLGLKAKKNFLPMQPGDVFATASDNTELQKLIGYSPKTSIEEGVKKFIDWYKNFYFT